MTTVLPKWTGRTDDGHRYHVIEPPDDSGRVVLEVEPQGEGMRWPGDAGQAMLGQSFGMNWRGKTMLLRVVQAGVNPDNGRLRLVCQ